MDTVKNLISAYLDNELSSGQANQLATVLTSDESSLDQFILDNVIHSHLLDLMNHRRLQDQVIGEPETDLRPQPSSLMLDGVRASVSAAARRTTARPRRLLQPTWGAVAATLLVLTSISTVAYVINTRPVYVGTLTEATGARWAVAQNGIAVGKLLQEGQDLDLITGTAVVTFTNGAKLYLEGPTTLRLQSLKDVQLVGGLVAAKVPRTAIGFTVHSSLAEFIDLGTEFTLKLDAGKAFQLHVFEGLVEVRLDERFGKAARRPGRFGDVQAATFDINSGDIATLPFQPGKKMPF